MKTLPVPRWKVKTRDVILESCRKWRPNLVWDCSRVGRLGDYVTLFVKDGIVKAEIQMSLRLVWKAGAKRNFGYLQTLACKVLDDYYKQHEAIRDHGKAAEQSWDKTITPAETRRTVA